MNRKLLEALLEEGYFEIIVRIKPTGVLNTVEKIVKIAKKRDKDNIWYNGDFLEHMLKDYKEDKIIDIKEWLEANKNE